MGDLLRAESVFAAGEDGASNAPDDDAAGRATKGAKAKSVLHIFLPGGMALRLWGRDPLHRHYRPVGLSYWIPRRQQPQPQQYGRQFLVEDRAARAELRPLAKDEPAPGGGAPPGSRS